MSVDPGIELGLTVFVISRRYRQTNSVRVRVRVRFRVRGGYVPTTVTRLVRCDNRV